MPRGSYHDMAIAVPATGLAVDYPLRTQMRYAIENPRGVLHAQVFETAANPSKVS